MAKEGSASGLGSGSGSGGESPRGETNALSGRGIAIGMTESCSRIVLFNLVEYQVSA